MNILSSQHNLTEVLFGMWFNPASNPWDSTYFGKFYSKIESLGYTEKQEQPSFQFKLELKPDGQKPLPEMQEIEPRMVFKNPGKGYAFIMAANYISFHKLAPYENWEALINNQVSPMFQIYQEMGLGSDLVQVQALYLNKYTMDLNEELSGLFSFIPSVKEFGSGKEKSIGFQSQYELDPNLIQQIKLNTNVVPLSSSKDIFLECSCVATAFENRTWKDLATNAHDQNNKVFKAITK